MNLVVFLNKIAVSGAPLVASLPHFYGAHEDYQKGVRGLNPEESKHAIIVKFEAVSAIKSPSLFSYINIKTLGQLVSIRVPMYLGIGSPALHLGRK